MPVNVERVAGNLAASTPTVDGLRAALLGAVRSVVPVDAAFVAIVDPETLLFTRAWAEEPLAAVAPVFVDHEFAPAQDVNRFAELAVARSPVASLDQATRGERDSSARYREVIDPIGLGDEMRVAMRAGSTTWGFLCLHRAGDASFAPSELATARRLAPHLASAISRTVAAAAAQGDHDGAPHAVIVATREVIVAVGGDADEWLEQADGRVAGVGDPLPDPLRWAVRRLEMVEHGDPAAPPAALRYPTRAGGLASVHATRLHDAADETLVVLTVSPAGAAERASYMLAAHGLTPAQRRVAALVVRGLTTRQIAVSLEISVHTVQDHLKAVFERFGVASRRELVGVLLHP